MQAILANSQTLIPLRGDGRQEAPNGIRKRIPFTCDEAAAAHADVGASHRARGHGERRLLLNVAEPPVRPPRLHGCHPTTKRIKNCDNCDPDQVDPAQAHAVTFWKVAVLSEKLLRCKALRDTEHDDPGVN